MYYTTREGRNEPIETGVKRVRDEQKEAIPAFMDPEDRQQIPVRVVSFGAKLQLRTLYHVI